MSQPGAMTDEACFGYTIGTGRLFLSMPDFHKRAEALLGRPIFTHEFGDRDTWDDLRNAFEIEALELRGEPESEVQDAE